MEPDYTDKYIFNKMYRLCNDVNRVMLVSEQGEDHNICMLLHPTHAIIMSVFTGGRNLKECISQLSDMFSVPEEKTREVVLPFIENRRGMTVEYDGNTFQFPENILVKVKKSETRDDVCPENYMIHPPYDFKSMRANYPKRILFVINLTCATDCFYCYADKRHNYVPMLTGRICELIDEARSIGVVSFDLSGGEVLLHPDWEIILGKLLKHGYKPYVSTKVPVSEDTIKRLKNIGVRKIQISLDSLDPELLANTINVGKSYADNIKETVLTFDRYGFDIVLKSTLTKTTCNRENVRDLLNFAAQFRHVSRYTCSSVGYSHFKGVRAFKEMIPSVAAVKDLESYLTSVKEDYKFEILDDLNAETSACMNDYPSFKKRSFCSGNLTSLIILPDGKVTICEELYWDKNFILGDLTQSSIMEVWRSDRAKYLSRLRPENFPKDSPCATCEDFQNCRNDRGICWKETIAVYGRNNWLFPDPRCPFAPAMINDVYYG